MQQDSQTEQILESRPEVPTVIARVTITWKCCHCGTAINVESGPILMQMLRGLGATLNCPRKECAKPLTVAPAPQERQLVQPAKIMPTNRERRGLVVR